MDERELGPTVDPPEVPVPREIGDVAREVCSQARGVVAVVVQMELDLAEAARPETAERLQPPIAELLARYEERVPWRATLAVKKTIG